MQIVDVSSRERICTDDDSSVIEQKIHDDETCGCEVGCGAFKSKRYTFGFLNRFTNAKTALAFLSLGAFLQGLVTNGFFNISISTLEKRFMLRSSETGFLSSAYDIAGCISIPVITYIGGRGHKPLWIGSGLLFMGLGTIMFSLPHFLSPVYSASFESDSFVCGENSITDCTDSVRIYRFCFIASQFLQGIGATPLYTLTLTYLDENVQQRHSSIYHGIFFAFSLFGPGVGYLLGGYLLTHYTEMNTEVTITQASPLWVGNWWIGFLIVGIFYLILAIPVLMYPRQLPGTESVRVDRENEMHQNEDAKKIKGDENFGKSIKDLPRCLLILIKNPTLIFISLAGAMDSGLLIGIATFGPKYIESMFSLSASSAAFYFGVLAIATASTAHLISGLLVSKWQMTVTQMMKMCLFCSIIAFGSFFIFLLNCENDNIAGVVVPYTAGPDDSCSQSACGCSVSLYNPICGSDNLTYLSYCEAGCTRLNMTHFSNCSRISQPATASIGTCEVEDCPHLAIFLFFLGLAVFSVFLKGQPALQTSLRSVPFTQRSFALGIQWLIIRIIGSIPMPIVYGKVLDISCLVWGQECGECGSCLVYDNQQMSLYMAIVTTILKGASSIFITLVLITYIPPGVERLKETADDKSSPVKSERRMKKNEKEEIFSSHSLPLERLTTTLPA